LASSALKSGSAYLICFYPLNLYNSDWKSSSPALLLITWLDLLIPKIFSNSALELFYNGFSSGAKSIILVSGAVAEVNEFNLGTASKNGFGAYESSGLWNNPKAC